MTPQIISTARWRVGLCAFVCLAVLVAAGPVRAAEPSSDAAAADARMIERIDGLMSTAWKSAGVEPAPPASDAEFLRRVYLDLTGRIPRVSEARQFLEDSSADKRSRLIEELLLHPSHASHLADVWFQFLLPDTANVSAAAGASDAFEGWLRNRFAQNQSYAETVRELLLATGRPDDSGPALYYTALELKPEKVAASTSRAFLGVQIQCAECHNHPFEKWTQRDFWGYAAFFARVAQQPDQQTMRVALVRDQSAGEVMLPNSKEVVRPRFLLGEADVEDTEQTRRMKLAAWMTSSTNPYFARAAVNRIWSQMFGRGLIDPPDDMRADQAARLADVLKDLSNYFVETDYDVRRLFRVLAGTRAYQLSSQHPESGERPPDLFAEMQLKVLSAEQLYACVAIATCRPYDAILSTVPSSMARRAMTDRDTFVASYRAPSGSATEYLAGIPQALMLLNGRLVDDATAIERSDILVSLEAPFLTDTERIETLFLATLSRRPSPEISRQFEEYVATQSTAEGRRHALGNILWALLNSAEFAMNH